VKIIHLSDSHIGKDNQSMGVNTENHLDEVIQSINQIKTDFVIHSGDISHDGTVESYQKIQQCFLNLQSKLSCIPGNHDNLKVMSRFLDSGINIDTRYWKLLSINTVLEAKTEGYVTDEAYKKFELEIESTRKNTLVVMHHPPISMESSWDDSISLTNSKRFLDIIKRSENIRCVIWGHAHESKTFNYAEKLFVSCPSTAKQFNDETRFGYNILNLKNNGYVELETQWI